MTNQTSPVDGFFIEEPQTAAETAAPTDAAEKPATKAKKKTEDIGNWRFTPWKGKRMWTNIHNSAWTSFDEVYVRKHRHLAAEPAKAK